MRQLCGQLKAGVGLATRVSAVKSLLFIVEKYHPELRSSNDSLASFIFISCLNVMIQSSISSTGLKNSLLSCLSAVSAITDVNFVTAQIVIIIDRYARQFSTHYDASENVVTGECVLSIIRKAGEGIEDESVWNQILSCSYIGSFHSDDAVSSVWTLVWNEALVHSGTGNKFSALLRISAAVIKQTDQLVGSLSWVQRGVGLSVISDLTSVLPYEAMKPFLFLALYSLLRCVRYRIWTGQGAALETIAVIFSKYCNFYDYDVLSFNPVTRREIEESDGSKTELASSAEDNNNIDYTSHCYVNMMAIYGYHNDSNTSDDADSIPYSSKKHRRSTEDITELLLQCGSNVKVSCIGVIDLLLIEATRGEKVYKFSAVKALSDMHLCWSHISNSSLELSAKYMKLLADLSGKLVTYKL